MIGQYDTLDNTIITFSWVPPQGNGMETVVERYSFFITPMPLSHSYFTVVYGEAINVTLEYNTKYNTSVLAVNCAGESSLVHLLNVEFSKLAIIASYCSKDVYYTSLLISVNCGVPQPPPNGFLGNYSHSKVGGQVTFWCNESYVPSAVMVSTCSSTGVWEPHPEDHNCVLAEGEN